MNCKKCDKEVECNMCHAQKRGVFVPSHVCPNIHKNCTLVVRKILFLDIDGVLNHQKGPTKNGIYCIDPFHVEFLNHIVKQTHCEIVISSTWRKYGLGKMQNFLVEAGFNFPNKVIGVTPHFQYNSNIILRGNEIYAWIKEHIPHDQEKNLSYCIVDDDSDMLLWQKDNFVKTTFEKGLTPSLAEKVIEILNKKTT